MQQSGILCTEIFLTDVASVYTMPTFFNKQNLWTDYFYSPFTAISEL